MEPGEWNKFIYGAEVLLLGWAWEECFGGGGGGIVPNAII